MIADKKKVEDFYSGQRQSLTQSIYEYDDIVYYRNRGNGMVTSGKTPETTASFATESTLNRFADDAVNSTYGMIWNAVEKPFSIEDFTQPDLDLSPLAEIMATVLEQQNTRFHQSLRHILRCFLEYGSGWMYVMFDAENGLKHRVFSIREVCRSKDMYLNPDCILLNRSGYKYVDDDYSLFKKEKNGKWKIEHVDNKISVKKSEMPFLPIQELSLTGKYDEMYPAGYGIRALADLKRYDNIIRVLTEKAAEGLNPIAYTSSSVNNQNRATNANIGNIGYIPDGSREKPKVIDLIDASNLPVGFVPSPISSADAWKIFEITSVNIRESFNFINRLLTIKDDAQMTATEVNVRTQADLSQVRDTVENIFSFLNEVHRVQFYFLKDTPEFKQWAHLDPANLNFFHTSIFKNQAKKNVLEEVNTGLDLVGKALQVLTAAQQAGVQFLDQEKILQDIAKNTRLALLDEQKTNALATILDLISQGQENVG